MKNLILQLVFVTFFCSSDVFSQMQLTHEARAYTSESGILYWNKKMPVYLRIASSPSEQGILLKQENKQNTDEPIFLDFEGKNLVRKKMNVAVGNTKAPIEISWEVYSDGLSPKTVSTFKNATYYKSETGRFYGGNLNVSLSAIDAGAGVENVYFSINEVAFAKYVSVIDFNKEGKYLLKYYAVDHVGNAENVITENFTVDKTAPKTYYNVTNITSDFIISGTSLLYLTIEDSVSGVDKTYFKIDNSEFKLYVERKIEVAYLSDGKHTLTYYSIDKVGNKEEAQVFNFYLDKLSPILASDILGDRFIVNDQIYFSGRTKLKLTAVDNKSGIKDVKYSIDSYEFQDYAEPFYLPSKSGIHVVKFYAEDKQGNRTHANDEYSGTYDQFEHNVTKVYVDLTGPSFGFSILGEQIKIRDSIFISSNSQIKLFGADGESGFQYIAYSLDQNMEELKYSKPFSLAAQGFHRISLFSYDNVNNRNIGGFTCIVDNKGPEIAYNFSITPVEIKDGVDVYPEYLTMYLSATDAIIGTDKIYYTVNNGVEKLYEKGVSGFTPALLNTLKIRAIDLLNNEREVTVKFYIR